MSSLLTSQVFGIMLALGFYILGTKLYQKTKIPFLNPLFVATVLLVIYIRVFQINVDQFLTDLSGIQVFLGPLIVSLAIPIYLKRELIKKNLSVILIGSFIGALSSILVVLWIGPLLGVDTQIITSMIPKSSTTPIAIEVSLELGGIRAITVFSVIMNAILGATFLPWFLKVFQVSDEKIIGITLGATSHAIGTAKALEINKEAGAISSVSLIFTGLFTVLIALFI